MTRHHSSTAQRARWACRLVPALVLASWVWAPADAQAKPSFGLDLDSNMIIDRERTEDGWGAGIRFGREWEPLLLTLNPELSVQYGRFEGLESISAYRFMGGARLGVGFIIEPSVFAHAGAGYLAQDPHESGMGLAYDAGAALDLTAIPRIDFGVHAHYAGITAPSGTEVDAAWWALGVHVEIKGDD